MTGLLRRRSPPRNDVWVVVTLYSSPVTDSIQQVLRQLLACTGAEFF